MYTLSRVLPDGSERPIVAGPPGRYGPSDPAACEFLPGETIRVGWTPTRRVVEEGTSRDRVIAELSLSEDGQLLITPETKDCTPSLVFVPGKRGEFELVLRDGDQLVAVFRYLDDVRVFAQVYPAYKPEASAPVV